MRTLFPFILLLALSSCSILNQKTKYEFADGKYSSTAFGNGISKVYVHNEEDKIQIYPVKTESYVPA